MFASIDIYKTVIVFLIYFTGGFFLYGAFFAAIGSAVDNLQDASQFTLPISLPIIASLMFMGVISPASFSSKPSCSMIKSSILTRCSWADTATAQSKAHDMNKEKMLNFMIVDVF